MGGTIRIATEARRPIQGVPDEVLAGYTDSDLQAFTELYLRYRGPIRRYLTSRTKDASTADDLTAQVFLKVLNNAGSFRGEGTYRAWLFQIARNTLANWSKDKSRFQIPVQDLPDPPDDTASPTIVALAQEERDLIWDTVDELPAAQREVVRLRYWKDLTIEEIARATGRTTGAIRVLLHRSRRSMASRLSAKDVTVILSATGAAASIALYSAHRQRRQKS